ncbi:conserved hypothetical protein [Rhodopseudomonas palustris HaA2]|uniref:DUF2130 domain-containing protein n=1 Tax=Rhodopseudomonas palustris (strain HaA2) TaxID=316058 RepID=Q2J3N4_RHOP2|nr:DUF2130 domain-containing protein [Rhodopseudomonas palustris]ABD04926.1 conserved hypothetical protein [Rhodopseudomonas palustris HaA2]
MTELTIICPNCATSVPLTESLAAPLLKDTQSKYERLIAQKDKDIAGREAALEAQRADLDNAKAAVGQQVAERIAVERTRIAAEEAAKAKRLAADDLDAKARQLAELTEAMQQKDVKLAEAQRAQAAFLQKQRQLEDEKRELDLTIEKRVQASLESVRSKAKQDAEEGLRLKVAEKEETIATMQRQIDKLKSEQGSQQLQGEVMELELEASLRARFPQDSIEPVPKGEFGGDVLHRVVNAANQPCGTILWESKRTKNWTDGWLTKLRDDQRKAKAELALIVSNALPKGVHSFDHIDGVWVAEARCAIPVAIALRQSLIELAAARQAGEGQQTKTELVYHYLTGPRFRQRVEAIVEKFTEMQSDLDKERRSMMRMWAKREAQIRGVLEATAGMYGDLQGIAGKALGEIDGMALPMLEDFSDDEADQAA